MGVEGKAETADTLNWIMKKKVTENEASEGVRNIRIKSDQRQPTTRTLFLMEATKREGEGEDYNTKGYQQNGSTVSINAVRL